VLPATVAPGPRPTLADKLAYAEALAGSDLVPSDYKGKPANVLLALEYGELLGVHPLVAMAHVYNVDGSLGLSAEVMRAKVRAAGHRCRVGPTSATSATVAITTTDDPDHTTTVTYTIDDAIRAGALELWWVRWRTERNRNIKDVWRGPTSWGLDADPTPEALAEAGAPDWVVEAGPGEAKRNDTWWRRPAAMLVARATSAAVRDACPEVLMGIAVATPDELGYAGPATIEPTDPAAVDTVAEAPEVVAVDTVAEALDAGPGPPPATVRPARQAQVDTIVAVSGGLDDAGKTSARRFADERGMNLQHLTEAEADAVLAHLATIRPPDREASPAGAGAT